MNWPSASAFFDMGGYGLYGWGSYAVTALLMAAEPWRVARRQRLALALAAGETVDTELQP